MVLLELEQYRQQFEQIAGQAKELTAGLSEAQFNWRPETGQWSIEDCLAHLTLVGQWEVRAIEEAIDRATERGLTGTGPFEYSALDRYILRETEPPVRHEMPSPKRFVPVHGQPITGILPTFLHVQRQFTIQLERADGLDLRRVKVVTPVSRFLKLSLGMTFAQAAAHERRHMLQSRRVRERMVRGRDSSD
jgi:DinB superfamily